MRGFVVVVVRGFVVVVVRGFVVVVVRALVVVVVRGLVVVVVRALVVVVVRRVVVVVPVAPRRFVDCAEVVDESKCFKQHRPERPLKSSRHSYGLGQSPLVKPQL